MDVEMRFHIEMEAAELQRDGLSPEEARRQALVRFGGVRRFKEEGREARGGSWLEDLMRDARYSVRSLWHSRGYAAVVVLTLALGIAANTSIFSVAHGILFKPLPYRDPARLMVLWDGLDWVGVPEAWLTGPEIVQLRREAKLFEGFAALRPATVTVDASAGAEPEQAQQLNVSANFFDVLGAGPSRGRGFVRNEDAPGAARVVIISNKLWRQRFLADPSIVGKNILINGASSLVIGVLPPAFRFAPQSSLGSESEVDLFAPLVDTLASLPGNNHSFGLLARVRGDVRVSDAVHELANLSRRVDEQAYGKQGFKFVPVLLQDRMTREVRPALMVLLAAVALLILIMCANLAVLSLVRAGRREREITVRRAIGAAHGRIARQILSETVLLSIVSGVLGTLLGLWALRGLLALAPAGLPRRDEIGIDLTVLAVTMLVALLVGVAMGLGPVIRSVRADIASVLRERAPSHLGGRLRHGLVLAQLALSLVLLAGTGLLLRSFARLTAVDPGFAGEQVLAVGLTVGPARYATGQPVVDVYTRYLDAIRALPGVIAAGATGAPPLSAGADQSGVLFPNSPTYSVSHGHDDVLADVMPATPAYFKAMGITLQEGRDFTIADRAALGKVAIVDDILAQRYYPNGGVLGQTIRINGDSLRVIGVVHHVRMYDLQQLGRGQAYVPHPYLPYRALTIAVRTNGDPMAIAPAVRRAIQGVDASQPIGSFSTMRDAISATLAERRLVLILVGAFAGAAVLLVALGIYGVTASGVAQRTRELGIRVALGADPRRVVGQVLLEPVRLVAFGLALGVGGTILGRRIIGKLLYDVSPTDPVTLAAVCVALLLVALLASYLPARRATRVDPMVALRGD
jgi:predicted permease